MNHSYRLNFQFRALLYSLSFWIPLLNPSASDCDSAAPADKIGSQRTWHSVRWSTASSWHFHPYRRRDPEGAILMLSRTCRLWKRLKSWPPRARTRWRISRAGSGSTRWGLEGAVADGRPSASFCWWCFLLMPEKPVIVWKLACGATRTASKARRSHGPPPWAERIPSRARRAANIDPSNASAAFPDRCARRLDRCHLGLIVGEERDQTVVWSDSPRCRLPQSKWAMRSCLSWRCRYCQWTRCCPRATSKKWPLNVYHRTAITTHIVGRRGRANHAGMIGMQ